jgi:hypothetical protein
MKCSTGKYEFNSRAGAMAGARRMERKRGCVLHAYPCGECRKWHLSNWNLAEYLHRATDEQVRKVADLLHEEILRDTIERQAREIAQEMAE